MAWIETEIEKLFKKVIKKQAASLLYEDQYIVYYQAVKAHCTKEIYPFIVAI